VASRGRIAGFLDIDLEVHARYIPALVGAIAATGTVALAGTGIGGIFNLGQANTVNATSSLSGASTGAQLQVTNTGTSTGAQGIVAMRIEQASHVWGSHVIEFLAIGTSVAVGRAGHQRLDPAMVVPLNDDAVALTDGQAG